MRLPSLSSRVIFAAFVLCSSVLADSESLKEGPDRRRPNIVFVLTDNQDSLLYGFQPMEKTQKLVADRGKDRRTLPIHRV